MTIEEKWWNKLSRILDDMPESVEILVDAYGRISAAPRGASERCFQECGNVDNVETLLFETWTGEGVENNGSSL